MYTRQTLLNNALDRLEEVGILLEHQMCRIAAIVEHQIRLPARIVNAAIKAPPEVFLGLSAPGEDGYANLGKSSCHSILRREDVASCPADRGTQLYQSLNEHRGLRINMGAAHDLGLLQGLILCGPLAQRHYARHLLLGNLDFTTSKGGFRYILDAEIGAAARIGLLDILGRQLVLVGAASETCCKQSSQINHFPYGQSKNLPELKEQVETSENRRASMLDFFTEVCQR